MTHYKRVRHLVHLIEQISQQSKIDYKITTDYNNDLWSNAKKAWRLNDNKKYHMVLQDDIVICDGFFDVIDELLDIIGNDFGLTLCGHFGGQIQMCLDRQIYWVKTNIVRGAQALVLPTKWIEDWINWCDNNMVSLRNDDIRLENWLRHTNNHIYGTMPTLVTHKLIKRSDIEAIGTMVDYYWIHSNPKKINWRDEFNKGRIIEKIVSTNPRTFRWMKKR